MQKRLPFFISFLFLFTLNYAFAQNEAAIVWQRCYGGSVYEGITSVLKSNDEGYILLGTTNSNDGDVSGNHGGQDYWIVKTDSFGNLLWQKCLGGSSANGDIAGSISATIDSGFIVAGFTYSNDGDVSGNHGSTDAWIVKLDSLGNIQWQKCYGGSAGDAAYSIIQTIDSGYVFAGVTQSMDGDVSGYHGGWGSDWWVVKMDKNGIMQWQKCLGGTGGNENPTSIIETTGGGYIVTGRTDSNDGDVSGNHGGGDAWVVKLDSTGGIQWQKCYGGSAYDITNSITQVSSNCFLLSGITYSTDGDITANHGVSDGWLLNIDTLGNLVWQKCFGGSAYDFFGTAKNTNDGGFIVAGQTGSIDGDVTYNNGTYDAWIIKLDSNINISWQKSLGGSDWENINDIMQLATDEYVIGGYSWSNDGDVSGNHGNDDMWLVKLTTHSNSIQGKAFLDLNSNAIQDNSEPALAHHLINETTTGRVALTFLNGNYDLAVLDTGNFSVYPTSIPYYNAVPASQSAYFSSFYQADTLNDFAMQPTGVFNDLLVTITPRTPFRSGANALYSIHYKNIGTTSLAGTIVFYPDTNVTFVSATLTPALITPDSVLWNLPTLAPYDERTFMLTVHVNSSAYIGQQINSFAKIEPVAGDADTTNNLATWNVIVGSSYDPNEILVSRDTILTSEISFSPYLDYIINFQNTGTDTAFNIKITDALSKNLNVSSFEYVSSTHPVNISYNNSERKLIFQFSNILLPDSNINEPASHGSVHYRIKPLNTLVAGDSILNQAWITFDSNLAVPTNVAMTRIESPVSVNNIPFSENSFSIFPNPTNETFTLKTKLQSYDLKISDITGRIIYSDKIINHTSYIVNQKFSSGIYFVTLSNKEKIYTQKLVVE